MALQGKWADTLLQMMAGSVLQGGCSLTGEGQVQRLVPGKDKAHFIHSLVILVANYSLISYVSGAF